MLKNLAILLLLTTASFANAFAEECSPEVSYDGETITLMTKGKSVGAAALREVGETRASGKARVDTLKDIYGREIAVTTRYPVRAVDSIVEEDYVAYSRLDRYCSQSSPTNAQCVSVCVRWSDFDARK